MKRTSLLGLHSIGSQNYSQSVQSQSNENQGLNELPVHDKGFVKPSQYRNLVSVGSQPSQQSQSQFSQHVDEHAEIEEEEEIIEEVVEEYEEEEETSHIYEEQQDIVVEQQDIVKQPTTKAESRNQSSACVPSLVPNTSTVKVSKKPMSSKTMEKKLGGYYSDKDVDWIAKHIEELEAAAIAEKNGEDPIEYGLQLQTQVEQHGSSNNSKNAIKTRNTTKKSTSYRSMYSNTSTNTSDGKRTLGSVPLPHAEGDWMMKYFDDIEAGEYFANSGWNLYSDDSDDWNDQIHEDSDSDWEGDDYVNPLSVRNKVRRQVKIQKEVTKKRKQVVRAAKKVEKAEKKMKKEFFKHMKAVGMDDGELATSDSSSEDEQEDKQGREKRREEKKKEKERKKKEKSKKRSREDGEDRKKTKREKKEYTEEERIEREKKKLLKKEKKMVPSEDTISDRDNSSTSDHMSNSNVEVTNVSKVEEHVGNDVTTEKHITEKHTNEEEIVEEEVVEEEVVEEEVVEEEVVEEEVVEEEVVEEEIVEVVTEEAVAEEMSENRMKKNKAIAEVVTAVVTEVTEEEVIEEVIEEFVEEFVVDAKNSMYSPKPCTSTTSAADNETTTSTLLHILSQ